MLPKRPVGLPVAQTDVFPHGFSGEKGPAWPHIHIIAPPLLSSCVWVYTTQKPLLITPLLVCYPQRATETTRRAQLSPLRRLFYTQRTPTLHVWEKCFIYLLFYYGNMLDSEKLVCVFPASSNTEESLSIKETLKEAAINIHNRSRRAAQTQERRTWLQSENRFCPSFCVRVFMYLCVCVCV